MAPSAITINAEYTSNDFHEKQSEVQYDIHHGKVYGKKLAKDRLKERIENVDTDNCEAGEEDAFFVADLGEVYRQHIRWKLNLNRVKPHYGSLVPPSI